MRYAWLEKMAADGLVREEILPLIYGECTEVLEKQANSATQQAYQAASASLGSMNSARQIAALLPVITAGIGLVSSIISPIRNTIVAKTLDYQTKSRIDQARAKVSSMYSGADQQKALARFDEIIKYAPNVASNPEVSIDLVRRKYMTGFTDADIQNLMSVQAKLTPGHAAYSSMSSYANKFASEQDRVMDEYGKACAGVYLLLEETEKFASVPEEVLAVKEAALTREALLLVGAPLMLAGVGGAIAYGRGKLKEKKLERDIASSYSAMLRGPHAEDLTKDPAMTQQVFKSLTHFAPQVASEPYAAGSFVKAILDYKSISPRDVVDLSTISRNMSSPDNSYGATLVNSLSSGLGGAMYKGVSNVILPPRREERSSEGY